MTLEHAEKLLAESKKALDRAKDAGALNWQEAYQNRVFWLEMLIKRKKRQAGVVAGSVQ